MTHAVRSAFLAILVLFCQATIEAAPVTLVLNDGVGNAGAAFEASNNFMVSGVTITTSVTSTLGSMTGVFNAAGAASGVDSDGITLALGDDASALDAGEVVTFTFTFSSPLTVSLSSFDFSGVGAAGDAALVTIGGTDFVLQTGATNFNGSSDVWSPNLALNSGDTLAIGAQTRLQFEQFTLDITAVPEPSSLAVLVAVGGYIVARRRKSVTQP